MGNSPKMMFTGSESWMHWGEVAASDDFAQAAEVIWQFIRAAMRLVGKPSKLELRFSRV
jgi:hypothetical protein